jgi:hypothetical protein
MSAKRWVFAIGALSACGGNVASDDRRSGHGGTDATSGTGTSGSSVVSASGAGAAGVSVVGQATAGETSSSGLRIPKNHRAAGLVCPQQRSSVSLTTDPFCIDSPLRSCVSDLNCTEGVNGRCIPDHFACSSVCSYDTCLTDSDCPDNEACECRASETSVAANRCQTDGNCRIDADCGTNGYCSPSQVGVFCFCPSPALCDPDTTSCYAGNTRVACACGDSCGHGYFCHTSRDACTDDSDCESGGTCNYDTVEQRWICAYCWPVP